MLGRPFLSFCVGQVLRVQSLTWLGMFLFISACDQTPPPVPPNAAITSFPTFPNAECIENGRARIYDQCADQFELFVSALEVANREKKVLLVSYGAEWCIWCHVFAAYIDGEAGSFTYTYGEEGDPERWTDTMKERAKDNLERNAAALNQYVADNFVVLHIDYEFAPRGDEVLIVSGAADSYNNWLPFIFTVSEQGTFAAALQSSEIEVRRNIIGYFRGYDREGLLNELKRIKNAAEHHDLENK